MSKKILDSHARDHETFAKWQPVYAPHGIGLIPATITEDGAKKPIITAPQNTTVARSEALAKQPRFASAETFGMWCGPKTGLTVVDMDSTDASIVPEAEKIFGASPLVWKTGSGKYAMAFRHNGEKRMIRVLPGMPIDLLGRGFAVAPPSKGTIASYRIIRGDLADLDRLPVARIPETAISDFRQKMGVAHEGQRHEALKAKLNVDVWHVETFEELMDCAMTFGKTQCDPPMPDQEIADLAGWFWTKKESGRLRRRGYRDWHDDVAELMTRDRDAAAILVYLRCHHAPSHRFYVANGLAKTLKMDPARFAAKRRMLESMGMIVLVSPATRHKPASWRWP